MTTISQLNPEIKYKDTPTIDDEDVGYASTVYELDLVFANEDSDQKDTETISVALGKPKYVYSPKNVVFFPIYAVSKQRVRAQIGVFEVESSKLLSIYKKGKLFADRLSPPILYSFATRKFIQSLNADPALFQVPETLPEPEAIEPILEKDQEDHLSLKMKSPKTQVVLAASSIFEEGVAEDDLDDSAPEETEADAAKKKAEYKESARNTWIEKYMKNNHYRIHENEGNGDCFFAVTRDAFAQIGKKTTVDQLRALVAEEMTDTIYQEHRSVYLGFQDEIVQTEKEMAQIKHTANEYKKRVQSGSSAADTKQLLQQATVLQTQYEALKKKKTETEGLQQEYVGYIKRVDTLEKMRDYIKTSDFWADAWTVSTLERLLNIKYIIFGEPAFQGEDLDGVIQCGEVNKVLQERQQFQPDYYILTSYTGNHYRLISYNRRKIFRFKDVPYDVKVLVLNKCLSKTSGAFYIIQDFRNFKTKFGMDADEGVPDDYVESPGAGDLFDTDTVFVFYARSDKSIKPGKGDGEKIPPEKTADYAILGSKAQIDWRKKLDDEWAAPLFLDKKKWASVEHYVQAAKYKKTHPQIYDMFSLDSVSNEVPGLSSDPKIAKSFRGLKGQKKIIPDLDYEEGEHREKALEVKFTANEELKRVLQLTRRALLLHKNLHENRLDPDNMLMKTRAKLG